MYLKMVENNIIYDHVHLKQQQNSNITSKELSCTYDSFILPTKKDGDGDNESSLYVDMNQTNKDFQNQSIRSTEEDLICFDVIDANNSSDNNLPNGIYNNSEQNTETSFTQNKIEAPVGLPLNDITTIHSNSTNQSNKIGHQNTPRYTLLPENTMEHISSSNSNDLYNNFGLSFSHERNSSSSSNDSVPPSTPIRPVYRKKRSFSTVSEKSEPAPENEAEEETIYAEIATGNNSVDITTSRITRESANPILRQHISENSINSIKRVQSLVSLQSNPLQSSNRYHSLVYGTISHNKQEYAVIHKHDYDLRSQSMERNYLKEKHDREVRLNSSPEIYQNTRRKSRNLKHRHSLYCYPEQVQERLEMMGLYENNSNKLQARHSRESCYQNSTLDIYENKSEVRCDDLRERSRSRPINIFLSENEENVEKELIYTDIDFKKSHCFGSCSSLPSSPRESSCSSMSSDFSSATSNPTSPPPLPSFRRNLQRMSSWASNNNGCPGMSYYPANYLGRQIVSKITRDVIDNCVSQIAQHTNVLEMKPVQVEITNEFVRFATVASPWELLVSFPIEEIIAFEVILKNAYFLGIVTGKPSEDACCYVLQSDKCHEIADTIRFIFKIDTTLRLCRSQSSFEIPNGSIAPEFHRYHFIVKIGTTKVKRTYLNVNDYIKIVLGKTNPKDFRNVNIEVLGNSIVITDTQTDDEEKIPTSLLRSLGVFDCDARYFGYILADINSNNKPKITCHVYRAARTTTAANIVETLTSSCQKNFTPTRNNNSSSIVNPIYSTEALPESDYQSQTSVSTINTSYSSPKDAIRPLSCIDLSTRTSSSDYWSASHNSSITSTPDTSPETSSRKLSKASITSPIGSTETLLTLTPSQDSSSTLGRCSEVISESRYMLESLTEDEKFNKEDGNLYQHVNPVSPKSGKKRKNKGIIEKFKQSIKQKNLQQQKHQINTTDNHVEPIPTMEPELFHFDVSYVCSVVTNAPLKPKHVKESYKQYLKEISKTEKVSFNNINKSKIGGAVSLQVITNESVSMLDPNRSDFVIRSFELDVFDTFMLHPEEQSCFAFSTTVPGNSKLKCHLFIGLNENIPEIERAFESMAKMKQLSIT